VYIQRHLILEHTAKGDHNVEQTCVMKKK